MLIEDLLNQKIHTWARDGRRVERILLHPKIYSGLFGEVNFHRTCSSQIAVGVSRLKWATPWGLIEIEPDQKVEEILLVGKKEATPCKFFTDPFELHSSPVVAETFYEKVSLQGEASLVTDSEHKEREEKEKRTEDDYKAIWERLAEQ